MKKTLNSRVIDKNKVDMCHNITKQIVFNVSITIVVKYILVVHTIANIIYANHKCTV